MTIAPRRQIACYTDLAAILVLVDPCPDRRAPPVIRTPERPDGAGAPSRSGPSASREHSVPDAAFKATISWSSEPAKGWSGLRRWALATAG